MKFISAKEALELSNKNKDKRIEYYLDNIENDQKVNKIKRDIEKAILNGEKESRTVFWRNPDNERREVILKYFTSLGYDISCSSSGIYYVGFVQRYQTPHFFNKK